VAAADGLAAPSAVRAKAGRARGRSTRRHRASNNGGVPEVRRIAMLSVHTSPLDAPGGGDAGGLNVFVVETAKRLAQVGVEVEVFTRATSSAHQPAVALSDGVTVRHVSAGPYEGLGKDDLPAQLCAFTAAVLRAEAQRPPGYYSLIHSHYWLSGQVGWLARDRWRVPLVHSAHTLAKVKNEHLAAGDQPEPLTRVVGETQVVAEADQLVVSTEAEAADLVRLYDADPQRLNVVAPGVDLATFVPGDQAAERRALGIAPDAQLLLFVGRLQMLKAPDLAVRVAAELRRRDPGRPVELAVLGAPSGSSPSAPAHLEQLAGAEGLDGRIRFLPPVPRAELARWYRAADLTLMPSYSESFGLVALEAAASGTPTVAARVGGLSTAVDEGRSGILLDGHAVGDWTDAVAALLDDPSRLAALRRTARTHAERYSWQSTTDALQQVYAEAAAGFAGQDAVTVTACASGS
jgi:D-inositol-3-phosphate glycosyltransferase